ncbi:MAG: prolyl oligopeptidase family serine peptidase, partial [Candidatus Aminicenantales bacterium]
DQVARQQGYRLDVIFVDEGPIGQREGQLVEIWMFDVDSKKETLLLDKNLIISGLDVSPDGEKVLFTARETNRRNDGYKNEIYLLDVATKDIRRLSHNRAPERAPLWAPSGKVFVYMAADDKEWLNRNSKIWLMDPAAGKHELISSKFEGNIRTLSWSPDSRYVYFNGQQGVNTNLFRLDVASREVEKLTDVEGSLRVTGFSKDHTRYVYIFSDYDTPPDVYTSSVEPFQPVRLTRANPWVEEEIELASMRLVRWKSVNDYEIEGLLHLPAGSTKGTRLPLILHIHGGPAGCFTNSFRASYHIWAGLGYVSLSPNVRGSSGYTDHLREGNTVQKGDGIGKGDYWDLMHGVDKVISEGYVDPDHIGLRGWSYGGILGGWTITQTNRFKAASLGAGVYDWRSEYGMGFNHDVRLWHIGGTPWDNPRAYRMQSAYTHVKNVSTPTLLIHGMRDTTDTEGQSMLFFTALKDIGKVPCRYIRVPKEPHGFREPRHQRIRDIEEIKWMQKYVRGIEWEPWKRPEEKKKGEKEEK